MAAMAVTVGAKRRPPARHIWRVGKTPRIAGGMTNIAFIGTGVMGAPMAGHLAAAGHTVTVYNRSRAKADAWAAKHGGAVAATPAEAAAGKDAVFSCVGNDDDLAEVTLGAGGEGETEDEGEDRNERDNSAVETTVHVDLRRFEADAGGSKPNRRTISVTGNGGWSSFVKTPHPRDRAQRWAS